MLDMGDEISDIQDIMQRFGIKCFKDGQADTKRTIRNYIETLEVNMNKKELSDEKFRGFAKGVVELIKKEISK